MVWALRAAAGEDPRASTKLQTFVVQSMIDDRKAEIGGGVVVARDGDVLTLVTADHVLRDGARLRIVDVARQAYYDVVGIRRIPDHDRLGSKIGLQAGLVKRNRMPASRSVRSIRQHRAAQSPAPTR